MISNESILSTRKPTTCSVCRQVGHNKAKCPIRLNQSQTQPNGIQSLGGENYPIYRHFIFFKIIDVIKLNLKK